MFAELRKLVRSMKKRRNVILELNDTQSARVLRKMAKKRGPTEPIAPDCESTVVDCPDSTDVPLMADVFGQSNPRRVIDATVYENANVNSMMTSVMNSMASGVCSDCTANSDDEDDLVEATLGRIEPSNYKKNMSVAKSVHSYAISPSEFCEDEPSEIMEMSHQDSEKIVSQFFGTTMTSIESSVQSSVEAYNEYIRLKHTIIKKLEQEYPKLHDYTHKKHKKFHSKLQKVDETEEVFEVQI
ncbi:unnamed protein product [Bursaphelenchus okinawaensis]|uniref:Uncharacterized protein n=1 Tax=Bursaphelenchus okinawaensis TaxID=465554 RepID=A0A811LRF8_9BILA|nr:unnamed protein product [Bursaphelenchus okinawaensis]CAG9127214.1 unnamed protein product [Bursaphelenchus okinawaensis]